jgi:hypothetical protein
MDPVAPSQVVKFMAAAVIVAVALASSGRGALAASPCGTASTPPLTYDHVIWIWMENKAYTEVIDNAAAPFTTQLAHQCARATNYAIVGSPSLPNYIGATAGTTFGITDDAAPSAHVLTGDNLFRQIRAAGLTEQGYQESMSGNCALTSDGTYAVKHNPAAYFTGNGDRTACLADNVPMGTTASGNFLDDLNNDTLPNFSFVTPNLCNDTHDCSVQTGDLWLQGWLPLILGSAAYLSGTTAVIITYDEYTPMPTVYITPSTPPGTVSGASLDHYALLRTTEEMFGISTYLGAAATAPSMRTIFEGQSTSTVGGIAFSPDVGTSSPASSATSSDSTRQYVVGATLVAFVAMLGAVGWRLRRTTAG